MKKYLVTVPYIVWVNVEVEADNEEEAKDIATEKSGLNSYCGNGDSDKLVGVSGQGVSIEAGDISEDIDIYVEELEDFEEDNEVAE